MPCTNSRQRCLPVVGAALDKLGERLQKDNPSQQFALQNLISSEASCKDRCPDSDKAESRKIENFVQCRMTIQLFAMAIRLTILTVAED